MHDSSLICNTADQVDGRCDQCSKRNRLANQKISLRVSTGMRGKNIHDSKNSTWPERLLDLTDATTSRHGFSFEEISALVLAGANERQMCFRSQRIPLTQERYDSRLAPDDFILTIAVFVIIFSIITLFVVPLLIVITLFVVPIINNPAWNFGSFCVTRGATSVVQNQLPSSEDEL